MRIGLQTHFDDVIDPALLTQLRAFGYQLVRMDAQKASTETMLAMIEQAKAAGLDRLLILSDHAKLREVPEGEDVEWFNEPDGRVDVRTYRASLDEACRIAVERGIRLWAPALSNLDEDSLLWLNQVRDAGGGWPAGLHGISVHRYGSGTFEPPHTGFRSREREVVWLKAAIGTLPFMVSEVGYPTDTLTEEQAAAELAKEIRFWNEQGSDAMVQFQLRDGLGASEKYGILRVDGTWKDPILAIIPRSAEATIAVITTRNGAPIPGAHVVVEPGGETDTNQDGYSALQAPIGGIVVKVTHPKFEDYVSERFSLTGNTDYRVELILKAAPAPQPGHGGDQHGFLKTRPPQHGLVWDFVDELGNPWLFAGYTMHLLLTALKKGVDIGPLLDEAASVGANTIVTIGTHLSQWKRDNGYYLNPLEPGYAELLAQMFDTCAAHGLRVAHAVLADAQGLNLAEQRRIWDLSCEVAKGRWNVLMRLGNEHKSNGYDPSNFKKPDLGGVLASTGSVGIGKVPVEWFWDFSEWEPRRDLDNLHKAMDDSGAGILEQFQGYVDSKTGRKIGPWRCPIIGIEPAFFAATNPDHVGDERWTDPKLALQIGLELGCNSSGGAFGCSHGLEAQPMDAIEKECAHEFYRGLYAAFLR